MIFNIFRKKKQASFPTIEVDLHSHLIPGVDDGVKDFSESIDLIRQFELIGYKKIITTPHIYPEFYNNRESDLQKIHADLVLRLKQNHINIQLELGAEYYLDDRLMDRMADPNESFLTFGNNYLLFETSFLNMPFYLQEFIFKAKSRGFNPILAHPERYGYLYNNQALIQDLIEREVLFQVNITSLAGYYSKEVKQMAKNLIKQGYVHFLGSDCHNARHFEVLKEARKTKYYALATQLPLKNYSL